MKLMVLVFLCTICITSLVQAQIELRKKHFNLEKAVAIQGYDPVAYFIQQKAIKGSKQFTALAESVIYYFSSAENRERFLKDYKKYEPQYGGWCAYAMGANNEKVEIDPETFKILDGKLLLFYHSWTNNTLNKWNKNEAVLKAKADQNWLTIYQ